MRVLAASRSSELSTLKPVKRADPPPPGPRPIMDAMRFGVRLVSATAFALLAAITGAPMVMGAPPTQISEIPDKFVIPDAQNDYLKRVEMIPMRDGVKLHTVIIIPK